MDTNNYYPQRDGQVAELDDESTTSSELLQAHLPESHVVKVFNNINFAHLGDLRRPAGDPERSALAIAGDDAGAKAAVAGFLDSIGYDALRRRPAGRGLALPARHPGVRRPLRSRRAGQGRRAPRRSGSRRAPPRGLRQPPR